MTDDWIHEDASSQSHCEDMKKSEAGVQKKIAEEKESGGVLEEIYETKEGYVRCLTASGNT